MKKTNYWKLNVSNGTENSGFSLFSNGEAIDSLLFNYSELIGTFNQVQSYTPNPGPALNNTLNLDYWFLFIY